MPHDRVKLSDKGRQYLADKIKEHRRRLYLTQSALAAKMGVDQSVISRLENGRGRPERETFRKCAAALGVSQQELLP